MVSDAVKLLEESAYRNLSMLIWSEIAEDLTYSDVEIMVIVPNQTLSRRFRDDLIPMIHARDKLVYDASTWQVCGPRYRIHIHPVREAAFRGRSLHTAYIPMAASLPEPRHEDLMDMWKAMIPSVASGLKVVEY